MQSRGPGVPTNAETAQHNPLFRKACELAGVPPTRRQASKWYNHRGSAYDQRKAAAHALTQDIRNG